MSFSLTPELEQIAQQKVSSGRYVSVQHVLEEALRLLDEHDSVLAAVREGYEDFRAGHFRTFEDADLEFRRDHSIRDE